jgi:hypothetical protein
MTALASHGIYSGPLKPSQISRVKTTLAIVLAATLLAGCTISTELDPEGFQSWRKKDRGITGSNLPRREGDEASVKGMEAEDLAKMQRSSGTIRTN